MRLKSLPFLFVALLATTVQTARSGEIIKTSERAIEVELELPAVSLFDLNLLSRDDQTLGTVTTLFDLNIPAQREKIRVTPLGESGSGDGKVLLFLIERLRDGVVLASQTISCTAKGEAENCVEPTADGTSLTVANVATKPATCGCTPKLGLTAGTHPTTVRVDWVDGPGTNTRGADLVKRLNSANLGVRFSLGTGIGPIPKNLKRYPCVLAYLRFLQEQYKSSSVLLGVINQAGNCAADRGRAASIGSVCHYCSVAVIEEDCLDFYFNLEHEVAHLLGANDTDAISHTGHTSGCTNGTDLMRKKVQPCSGLCDSRDIVICDHTRSELKDGPAFMATQTCNGLP